MTYNKTELTQVEGSENLKVVYERRRILGGMISWWVRLKADSLGKDLIIRTSEVYDNIYFNGVVLTPKDTNQ